MTRLWHCNSYNIPKGSYELRDIEQYPKHRILRSHDAKGKKDEEFPNYSCQQYDEKWN